MRVRLSWGSGVLLWPEVWGGAITPVQRELLSIADEVFFTGTAAEITPVRSIAKIQVGNGKPGPVTKKLQEQFFDIIRNGNDTHGWLKFI